MIRLYIYSDGGGCRTETKEIYRAGKEKGMEVQGDRATARCFVRFARENRARVLMITMKLECTRGHRSRAGVVVRM